MQVEIATALKGNPRTPLAEATLVYPDSFRS